jgi:hypothetical protein
VPHDEGRVGRQHRLDRGGDPQTVFEAAGDGVVESDERDGVPADAVGRGWRSVDRPAAAVTTGPRDAALGRDGGVSGW